MTNACAERTRLVDAARHLASQVAAVDPFAECGPLSEVLDTTLALLADHRAALRQAALAVCEQPGNPLLDAVARVADSVRSRWISLTRQDVWSAPQDLARDDGLVGDAARRRWSRDDVHARSDYFLVSAEAQLERALREPWPTEFCDFPAIALAKPIEMLCTAIAQLGGLGARSASAPGDGDFVSLQHAVEMLPELKESRPHLGTLRRWSTRGVGGVKLRTAKVGRTRCTTRRWVIEFCEHMAASPVHEGRAAAASAQRATASPQRSQAEAQSVLRRHGVIPPSGS